MLWVGDWVCLVIGCILMDLIMVDVIDLFDILFVLEILNVYQGVDVLVEWFGIIGYEILILLGQCYLWIYL